MASPRVAVAHADWLTLVDPHGPFLTLPVLRAAWPNGLDRTPTGARGELRSRIETLGTADAERRGFADWVLRRLLGYGPYLRSGQQIPDTYTVTLPEHGETLRPDWVVAPDNNGATGTARLLVSFWPATTDFAAHVPDTRWTASPSDRMVALCRATGVELGLVTDGVRWQLVWAGTGAVGRATWSATIFAEAAERTLLDSFTSVLGARRLFSVAVDQTLETLLAASADAHAEITTTLGRQVRQAVELLVGAFSRANREVGGKLLAGIDPHTVYEAAVTVMMRLVFLLYAEERRLLPLGENLYDSGYAVSTLRQRLRDVADTLGDEQALEYRHSAWPRLLATFRAVWGGLAHDELRVPAYGGRFFDPDSYPFLEGRRPGQSWRDVPGEPLPVDDRTILAILTALQVLQIREGGVTEARRLSFRSLDVEQIGHVYEGLLDHGARRVDETTVGLIGKPGNEPEVALSGLLRAASGEGPLEAWRLSAWIAEHTGLTPKKIAALLDKPLDDNRSRLLLAACEGDQVLHGRLAPFAWVMRDDLRGLPAVIPAGAIYVTEVSHRRDSGTEYTTRELAEDVARYTLEPLVYSPGPADGAETADWKPVSSERILALRVCDPAVGSGAILTAVCRFLADRLVVAWTAEDNLPVVANSSAEDDVDDVVIEARRAVAERCLYGVDRDPMAVEMAKLSLWLVTMAKDRPFSFLDHALQTGDSLLGVTSLDQVAQFHIDPAEGRKRRSGKLIDYAEALAPLVERAVELRRRIEAAPVQDVRDAEEKARLLDEATATLGAVRTVADLVVGAALSTTTGGKGDLGYRLDAVGPEVAAALDPGIDDAIRAERLAALEAKASAWLNAGRPDSAPLRRPLHWPVAFPEVFAREQVGFDACVGNPPFLGGKRLSGAAGKDFRAFLVEHVANGAKGSADLVAYFFLQASRVSHRFGLLATNTLTQGDTREVGLDELIRRGWTVDRAVKSTPWPGSATLEIAKVWAGAREWLGGSVLDGETVQAITSSLDPVGRVSGPAERLAANAGQSFIGSFVLGMGFVLDDVEARDLLQRDSRNADVIFPYLNGEDVTNSPTHEASRFVINFFDWPVERARRYPDCWTIIEERVRPERQRRKDNGDYALRKPLPDRYWIYADKRPALYNAIRPLNRTLAVTRVSKVVQPVWVPTNLVISDAVVVFAYDDDFHFGVLSSAFHWWWAIMRSSTLETRIRYTPSDVFETFPQPDVSEPVGAAGKSLDEHRAELMMATGLGLTKTYNRFNDQTDADPQVDRLRGLHRDLDVAVRDAYNWSFPLDHGFHDTSQGVRYTLGPAARIEVLDRLLELNHARYAEEVRSGLHDKKRPGAAKRRPTTSTTAPDQLALSSDTPTPEDA